MDSITATLKTVATYLATIDYTPLKNLVDLNDVRSLAAILAAVFAVRAGVNKIGHKAIYQATITHSKNRVSQISNLTIANLKDKPLVVYEVVLHFKDAGSYIILKTFSPPLVIKNFEATSITPEPYSSISIDPNPLDAFNPKLEIALVTESKIVICKNAKGSLGLTMNHFKGKIQAAVSRSAFNNKLYSSDALYAILWSENGATNTSFLMRTGFITDEWPFPYNAIPPECLASDATLADAIETLSQKIGVKLLLQRLTPTR